ncbi:unnamed protein product, partial [marine sediment metagenome]
FGAENEFIQGGNGVGVVHAARFEVEGMAQPITSLINNPDDHFTIRGKSSNGGTILTSINNEDATVMETRAFVGIAAPTFTGGIMKWRAGVGNGGTGFSNASNGMKLYEWTKADSTPLFSILGNGDSTFAGSLASALFSSTGATIGAVYTAAGTWQTSHNTTAAVSHYSFFNPNGFVGNITTSLTATAYNTSSDPDL